MDVDEAYLVGALADGSWIHQPSKHSFGIEFEEKKASWLKDAIVPRLLKLFGKTVSVKRRKSGLYRVRLFSKTAYARLKHDCENLGQLFF